MSKNRISRREFLKLISMLPLVQFDGQRSFERKPQFMGRVEQPIPNILILVFDTLSAKHMSLYGYRRKTTPYMSRFAERATVFHNHHSTGNFTLPGTASLLTGTHPWSHRGFHLFGTILEHFREKNLFGLLAPKYHTLAYTHNSVVEILYHQFRKHLDQFIHPGELGIISDTFSEKFLLDDYQVAFWSEHLLRDEPFSASLFFSLADDIRGSAISKRMDSLNEQFPRGIPTNAQGLYFILEDAIDWLIDHLRELPQPFLAYIHLFPPHHPYYPRKEFVDIFDDGWVPSSKPRHHFAQDYSTEEINLGRRHYDEYIAYADAEFGRLIDFMSKSGILENSYFVLTSDHGEMFERGIYGHLTKVLYEPLTWVPLLISKPGQKSRFDVHTLTSCVDLMPTFLEIAGLEIPKWCEGAILPTFPGYAPNPARSVFSLEAKSNAQNSPLTIGTISMMKEKHKLIHYFGYPEFKNEYEFYDLEQDPEELENDFTPSNPAAAALQDELWRKLQEVNGNL